GHRGGRHMSNKNDVCRCGHLRKNHGNPIFPCMADGCQCSGFRDAPPAAPSAEALEDMPECACEDFCRRRMLMKTHPEQQFWCRVLRPAPDDALRAAMRA